MSGAPIKQVVRLHPSVRIEQDICSKIESGILKPNDRLQAETQLAAAYDIGVYDVRVALRRLKKSGYLNSRAKSGVFVAETLPPVFPNTSGGGFHALDVVPRASCTLSFVVSGWTDANRSMWERICRDISRIHPKLTVQPVFPENGDEYRRRCLSCDVFVAPTTEKIICNAYDAERTEVNLLDRTEIAGLPVEAKYLQAVTRGEKAVGVPLCGTLIMGGLNPDVLPSQTCDSILKARSWDAVFGLLAAVGGPQAGRTGLNLHAHHTLSLKHYLTHQAGPLVDPVTGAVRIRRPEFRKALESLEEFRNRAFHADDPEADAGPESYAAYAGWTFRFARQPEMLGFTPWLLPLGDAGTYVEGLNIAAISRHTAHPEESRKFLFYLLSDDVQRELAQVPGEHPVSSNVSPFVGFDAKWRELLEAVKARSSLTCDYRPGFWEFMGVEYDPAATQFFRGELSATKLIDRLDARAKIFLAG